MYSRSRYSAKSDRSLPYTDARSFRPEWVRNPAQARDPEEDSSEREIRLPPMYSGNAFTAQDNTSAQNSATSQSNASSQSNATSQNNASLQNNAAARREPVRFDFRDATPDEPARTGGTAHGIGNTARDLLLPHEATRPIPVMQTPDDRRFGEAPSNAQTDGIFAPRFPLYESDDRAETPFYPAVPRHPANRTRQNPIGRSEASGHGPLAALSQELIQGIGNLPSLLGKLSEEDALLGILAVLLLSEGNDDLTVLLILFLLFS